MIDLTARKIGDYKEVIITIGNTKVDLGLLEEKELKELAIELRDFADEIDCKDEAK